MSTENQNEERLGFGFAPGESEHFFLVHLPHKGRDEFMYVTERFRWDEGEKELPLSVGEGEKGRPDEDTPGKLKIRLARSKWERVAEDLKAEFNARLRAQGEPTGTWEINGQTPVSRLLGKELLLLLWAIEDADSGVIAQGVSNWRGLAPEERWWMFTMTNAASGHYQNGKGVGWRKAVRYALTENPSRAGSKKPIGPRGEVAGHGLFGNGNP